MKPKVLILEDSKRIMTRLRDQFEGEVDLFVAETAAEAWGLFRCNEFDVIVLDGIFPSTPGGKPSLVGPVLAREFRKEGYRGPIIATSTDPKARKLTKEGASKGVKHLAYVCDKSKVPDLIRELLGNYSAPSK